MIITHHFEIGQHDFPVLSVSQFKRFMEVIKKLGDRVEKEHDQYLRDSQRIEDRSATTVNGTPAATLGGAVDFESLVGGQSVNTVKADTALDSPKGWDDDVWGSILNGSEVMSYIPSLVSNTYMQVRLLVYRVRLLPVSPLP